MDSDEQPLEGDCVIPGPPVPPEEAGRYGITRDPHAERDIASYVEREAHDEAVTHVEKVKEETLFGRTYEIWDVTTDKNRWWVITNLTNLYSQKHFASLDYTFSFHVGLMTRMMGRQDRVDAEDPHPFDEVFRRLEQAEHRHDVAVEAEDYQAIGMQLRECLISLAGALRRRVPISHDNKELQDANFLDWSSVLINELCSGAAEKQLRKHLKSTAKETWQLVSWLTHDRDANHAASTIAIHACSTLVGHLAQLLERARTDKTDECPVCRSRKIRTHFDPTIGADGDYSTSCGVCDWDSHPGGA